MTDSTGFEFTHKNTVIDQENSHFESGVELPDGTQLWGNAPGYRGINLPTGNTAPTEAEQGRVQDHYAANLRSMGITPTKDTRLKFLRRPVVISYGTPEEVPAWL